MAELTARHQAFVNLMKESDELARRGFDLLLKRQNPELFFDALHDAGLFAPQNNPAPVPAEEPGYVRVPYWSPLDYLTGVAKIAGQMNDVVLAEKVMSVVRAVSLWRNDKNEPTENYHTYRKFAEIIGAVPTQSVTLDDVALVPIWLHDRFNQGMMIGHAFDQGALSRFVNSLSPIDWDKAVEILRHCTAIHWQPPKEFGDRGAKPVSAVDDYWLKQLLEHHVASLATRRGRALADLFVDRLHEVFAAEGRREYGYLFRPAIEEHSQNHDWHDTENRAVEGLRDTLVAWCETGDARSREFVERLFDDAFVVVQRIAIFVVSKCWAQLDSLLEKVLEPKYFDSDYLHEVYNLLKEHFSKMPPAAKERVVELIRQIPVPDWSDQPERALKAIQRRWLTAIHGKGDADADVWFVAIAGELGPAPEHPDFLSFSEVRSGPGPSPYSAQDLIAFLHKGSLVEKLNSFESAETWTGPTVEGLLSTLEEAVKSHPAAFLRELSRFRDARTPYQHAVLWGLKQVWEKPSNAGDEVDWQHAWLELVTFFETLIASDQFWEQPDATSNVVIPSRSWIASTIAEFLQSGTRSDERSYPPVLFPRTRRLVTILLERTVPAQEPGNDAMFQAINSPKGKAIEALVSQALMECRAADRVSGSHAEVWATFAPLFETELRSCQDTNFEFSTLAGAYLTQFMYMNRQWIEQSIPFVFPEAFPKNAICAIDGLAYAPFTKEIYRYLVHHGVIERALRYELQGRVARQKLLERLAVGYLWKEDELDSERFAFLFRPDGGEDLVVITHLFWSIRHGDLPDEQRERILAFWERSIRWSREGAIKPEKVLSTLSTLASILTSADGRERELLEAVAPQVHIGYNAHNFVEDLTKLVDVSPDGVSTILKKVLAARVPDYDYQDRLRSLLERLVEKGKREDVIQYANQLRNLSTMQQFYDRLRVGT